LKQSKDDYSIETPRFGNPMRGVVVLEKGGNVAYPCKNLGVGAYLDTCRKATMHLGDFWEISPKLRLITLHGVHLSISWRWFQSQ
jgi:hypothetical protein